jgi:hypothetical protein
MFWRLRDEAGCAVELFSGPLGRPEERNPGEFDR